MSSAPTAPRHRVRFYRPSKRTCFLLLTLIVVILMFEITTRTLRPDGMIVTSIQSGTNPNGPDIGAVTTITHFNGARYQAAINQLYDTFNAAPRNVPTYLDVECPGRLSFVDYQITFTWHGQPIESWANDRGCSEYMDNSGGIPNLLWSRTLSPDDLRTLDRLLYP